MDNGSGERFLQSITPLFSQSGICVAFTGRIPNVTFITKNDKMIDKGAKLYDDIMGSKANVVVAYGESYSVTLLRWFSPLLELQYVKRAPKGKVWIITAEMEFTSFYYQRDWDTEILNGALSFTVHSNELPRFPQFVESNNPSRTSADGFIKDFWEHAFDCMFPNLVQGNVPENICTGEEKLESLPGCFFEEKMTGPSYSIYNAVSAVAHALHAMASSGLRRGTMAQKVRLTLQSPHLWQVTILAPSCARVA